MGALTRQSKGSMRDHGVPVRIRQTPTIARPHRADTGAYK